MSSPPPLISNHRLARLALWLLAMLAWFVLGGQGNDRQRRRAEISFDKIERAVRNVIIIGAARLMPPRKSRRHHVRKAPRIRLRAIAGVWLRRRLRTRGDLIARATQLLAALRTWRELAAALAQRRSKGLTRLAPVLPRTERAAPVSIFALPAPCAADTS